MALRIIFLIIGFTLIVNIVLMLSGLIFGVNLYQKYSKQILIFFALFALFIVAVYVVLALIGLVH